MHGVKVVGSLNRGGSGGLWIQMADRKGSRCWTEGKRGGAISHSELILPLISFSDGLLSLASFLSLAVISV